MVANTERFFMSPSKYLAWEEQQTYKHEYLNGEAYAISGGTLARNQIAVNLVAMWRAHLRDRGYQSVRVISERVGRQTLLARNIQTQELVVIKLLLLGEDFEWQELKLFEREAQSLQALSHPAIPSYVDYLDIDEPDCKGFGLVQSYVDSKPLEQHLKSGRTFSSDEVKELAKSLLEILIYLHGHQPSAIHRDIKPSNILLTDRSGNSIGQVHLVDFGSVQNIAAREGGTITVVGTYGYMPPEQFGGRTTPASNLYSLGATLISLITGLHPTELPQEDFRIQFREVLAGRSIDRDLITWLEHMTEPSLDKRLNSATEALQALENPQPTLEPVRVVRQPPGSEVVFRKNAHFLEIPISPKGLGYGAIASLSFATPLLLWLVSWIVDSGSNSWNYIWLLIGLSLLLLGIIIWGLFRQVRLRIARRTISITNELLGFKWQAKPPAAISDISKVELRTPLHNGQTELNLIVGTRHRKYAFGQNNRLDTQELYWLAAELSDRLGLPITEVFWK